MDSIDAQIQLDLIFPCLLNMAAQAFCEFSLIFLDCGSPFFILEKGSVLVQGECFILVGNVVILTSLAPLNKLSNINHGLKSLI